MQFRDLSNNIGKNILKIKPGEEARIVFRGNPVDFRQHWKDNRSSICAGRDKCDLCKSGEKSSFRFRVNVAATENGAYVAKVFEQGKAVYEALKALNQDYDLEKNFMKVRRHGSGTDTTYAVIPVPNGEITADAQKAIAALPLHSLEMPQGESRLAIEDGDEENIAF